MESSGSAVKESDGIAILGVEMAVMLAAMVGISWSPLLGPVWACNRLGVGTIGER